MKKRIVTLLLGGLLAWNAAVMPRTPLMMTTAASSGETMTEEKISNRNMADTETDFWTEDIADEWNDYEEPETEIRQESETEIWQQPDTESWKERETELWETETELWQLPESETWKETEQIGTEWETESDIQMMETEVNMETETNAESEKTTETEDMSEAALEFTDEMISTYVIGDLPASGTLVSESAGWSEIGGVVSDFVPMRFYPGISSVDLFYDASTVVCGEATQNRKYLYPKSNQAKGQYGGFYRRVIYYQGKWYDLKYTVVDFSDVTDSATDKDIPSYSPLVVSEDKIEWIFNEGLGAQVLKCEILDSETGLPGKVNTRLQWGDIDGSQRFAIRTIDSTITGRYYHPGTLVHYQESETVCGIDGMETVTGPPDSCDTDDRAHMIAWELTDCSSYYMAFPYRDHHGEQGYDYKTKSILSKNEELRNGIYQGSSIRDEGLVQTETTMREILTPNPVKKVSSDGMSWADENLLRTPEDPYWYEVTQYIPWQDIPFFYSDLQITDQLETGVHYLSDIQVVREEDNIDVSDWFVLDTTDDLIQATVKSDILTMSDFYGYHYKIRFQAEMKKEELAEDANSRIQTFQAVNTAKLCFTHLGKTDSEIRESNTVTTIAQEIRRLPERELILIKEIVTDDIVWEHGNPVFTFHIYGTDHNDEEREYYRTVEYQKGEVSGEKSRMEVHLILPEGIYTVEELPVMRYCLKSVSDIKNGTQDGNLVTFNLIDQSEGSAVFFNEKTTDEGTSDTAMVRNIIS